MSATEQHDTELPTDEKALSDASKQAFLEPTLDLCLNPDPFPSSSKQGDIILTERMITEDAARTKSSDMSEVANPTLRGQTMVAVPPDPALQDTTPPDPALQDTTPSAYNGGIYSRYHGDLSNYEDARPHPKVKWLHRKELELD